jgi:Zn-dependent protease/predicted transcriptional regulator
MNETLRLGTIAGVRVGVNWSVLVIVWLLLVGLSAGRFPLLYPGHSGLAYGSAGAVAAIAFLLSLLAHELAHAVVARHHGITVEGITLWMFGGVAKLEGEPRDPAADLRIAGVGPLVSLALGLGFWVVSLVAGWLGAGDLLRGMLGWLSVVNVVLAVFNLVPAAPLDGGRILRALLWHRHGDRVRAAVTAARAGRRFGFSLVMVGIVLVVFTGQLGGVWFALIGWFISSAASAEEQQTRIQDSLHDVLVAQVMSRDPVIVPVGLSVTDLLDDYVLRHRFSAFPVVDAFGRPRGLVTLNRIKAVPPERRATSTVETVACPFDEVPHAAASDRLVDVLPAMARSGEGRVLVLDGDRIVGIVSATDVTRAIELAELRPRTDPTERHAAEHGGQ